MGLEIKLVYELLERALGLYNVQKGLKSEQGEGAVWIPASSSRSKREFFYLKHGVHKEEIVVVVEEAFVGSGSNADLSLETVIHSLICPFSSSKPSFLMVLLYCMRVVWYAGVSLLVVALDTMCQAFASEILTPSLR
jgi:hypothetical protein